MTPAPVILLVGTVDTKSDEIAYLRRGIEAQGASALVMDVGVLGRGALTPDIANSEVAQAAGLTLQALIACGDESECMTAMARGAALLAAQLHQQRRFDGLLALGGTMGTDLALDVANALPLGVPKVVLSTIAHSHLIPPERIPPDLIMRLWAGGLYGLNRLCESALSQAAGAAVGACLAAETRDDARPLVGMTSLGTSALRYMTLLKPALEARGYELAVFHTTGMGGRAFEDLAAKGLFAAVMDFSLQELVNHLAGSCVSAGADRLRGAGRAGVPQIVAPGATDMVDYATWATPPARYDGRAAHEHNRLISSVCVDPPMRREVARAIGERLAEARAATCVLLPTHGIEAWDRPGEPLHDPEGLAALVDELPRSLAPQTQLVTLDAHINDAAFAEAALDVFDAWVRSGQVAPGRPAVEAA
ncbi:MAG: Tm-1-like ATP-binding domain-containing protein [Rhizobacter sp.]|nr:Tm-1-like ATP-binding domain-containing protein [Rhizobacter sp.]